MRILNCFPPASLFDTLLVARFVMADLSGAQTSRLHHGVVVAVCRCLSVLVDVVCEKSSLHVKQGYIKPGTD